MGFFDDAVPGGNISKPVMMALGALLAGNLTGQGGGQQAVDAPSQPANTGGGLLGGLFSQVSNMLGGAGTGAAAGGGIGALLQQFNQAGLGQAVNSWVGNGPNHPVQPDQVQSALGQTTVSDLAQHAGMNEQDLLQELSRVLPGVVDKLTSNGQIPSQSEVTSSFSRFG